MAVITIELPIFRGGEDDDLFNYIDLYQGHLNSLGINPLDLAANPSGSSRSLGILRGSIQGESAEWFDREITGKNWKINNVNAVVANGLEAAFKALLLDAPPAGGTFRAGSNALNFASMVVNAELTISNTM